MLRAQSSDRRVVITGIGLISPLGNSPSSLWEALVEGRSGVRPLTSLPSAPLPCPFAAEAIEFTGAIDDFGPLVRAAPTTPQDLQAPTHGVRNLPTGTVDKSKQKAIRKGIKMMCRETQMGVAAAQRAFSDSGLDLESYDPERMGVIFGSDYMLTHPEDFAAGVALCSSQQNGFDFDRWGSEGLGEMSPLWLLKYLPNMPASHIAIYNDLRGPSNSITHREAAGILAIGEAFHTIRRGHADRIISGATGTRVHPMKTVHAVGQETLARADSRPEAASRPFDKDRTGMVLGEGAAAVVLEEMNAAEERGATIHAEVLGSGSAFAADQALHGKWDVAIARAIGAAISDAHLSPADIGHIHAHGLSGIERDAEEARAINAVFGECRANIPVVAAKGHFGNLGAGSGVVELIASILALHEQHLFATLNYATPDPACPIHVVTDPETDPGMNVLTLSATPQGQAAALLVSKLR